MQVRRPLPVVTAALALLLAGCGAGADLPAGLRGADSHATSHAAAPSTAVTKAAVKDVPLREGERFQSIRLPSAYTPKAPTATGTDDYRCFLLDPGFDTDQLVSGVQISPDNAAIVHHVIVSKVEPDQVATAKALDAKDPGDGYTCFGGAGIAGVAGGSLDDADWVGAWAPGGGERVMADDIGIPLKAGTQLVVQMHYNLLAGTGSDRSTVRLRLSEAKGSDKQPLQTMLLPAPVELPCRDNRTKGLCNRTAGGRRPEAALRRGPRDRRPAAPALRARRARAGAELHPPGALGRHHPGGRRAHAPARPRDHRRRQQGHPQGRAVLDIPSGTSTTRAASR